MIPAIEPSGYVGMVVVNYRTAPLVAALIRSLHHLSGQPTLRIIVVDNSESNAELTLLRQHTKELPTTVLSCEVIAASINLGFGAGNNFGYARLARRYGDPSVVVVANPDTRVIQGDLDAVLALADVLAPHVWVARTVGNGSPGLYRLQPATGRSLPITAVRGRPNELVYPGGHFLLMPQHIWRRVDGFAEDFFLYGEELDLILRLQNDQPGVIAEVSSALTVTHQGAASMSTDRAVSVGYREATRSRVILYRRHRLLNRWLPVLTVSRVGFAALLFLRGRRTAAQAVVSGLWDGWSRRSGDATPDSTAVRR